MKIAGVVLPLFTFCAVTSMAQTHTVRSGHARRNVAALCPDPNPLPPLPPGVPPATGKAHTAFALRYVDTQIGTGAVAGSFQFYTVHYTGWLGSNGTKFDSSRDRNEPFTFQQGTHHVIPGWDSGLIGMRVGGKRRLYIPYQLAYGELGRPPEIPQKADLIFDVELLAVSDNPPAPNPPPPDENPSSQPNPDTNANPATNPTPPPIHPADNNDTTQPPH